MGKKRITYRVKELSPKGSKIYAVYIHTPSGTERRVPNTDSRDRASVIVKARKIREYGRVRYGVYRGKK